MSHLKAPTHYLGKCSISKNLPFFESDDRGANVIDCRCNFDLLFQRWKWKKHCPETFRRQMGNGGFPCHSNKPVQE